MFEQQIKAEPMGFYSTCPPPPQMLQALQPQRSDSNDQQQQQSVIINDKDMQPQPLIVVSRIAIFIVCSAGAKFFFRFFFR